MITEVNETSVITINSAAGSAVEQDIDSASAVLLLQDSLSTVTQLLDEDSIIP